MVAGIKATCQRLDGSMKNDSLSESNNESMDFIYSIILFAVIGVGIAFLLQENKAVAPNAGNIRCKEAEAELSHGLME